MIFSKMLLYHVNCMQEITQTLYIFVAQDNFTLGYVYYFEVDQCTLFGTKKNYFYARKYILYLKEPYYLICFYARKVCLTYVATKNIQTVSTLESILHI